MRAFLPAALLLSAALTACGKQDVKDPGQYRLSGTLQGDWGAAPRLRLALVGTGLPVAVTFSSNIAQNIVPTTSLNTWNFGFELPDPPIPNIAGVFQVIAFDDANNDAQYTVGEPLARNRQWLIYSPLGGKIGPVNFPSSLPAFIPWQGEQVIPEMNVSRGWNLYDRAQPTSDTNPRGVTTITGYDIFR